MSSTVPETRLFAPATIRGLTLRNRLFLAPMCQYALNDRDGLANDWQLTHLGARAAGGFSLVITEATAVAPEGRISAEDVGLWSAEHEDRLARVVDFVQSQGAAAGVQLAHAGAKAGTEPWLPGYRGASLSAEQGGWQTFSPAGINPVSNLAPSTAMSRDQIQDSVGDWVAAAQRADRAGFDVLQIHAAHGYLIHQFLTPVTNQRTDDYGGNFDGRTRYLREIVAGIRDVWPEHKPLMIRFSGSDWVEGSWSIEDTSAVLNHLPGVDMVDVSSGGIGDVYTGPKPGPGYQLPLATRIKTDHPDLFVSGVGSITSGLQAEEALQETGIDALSIGRAALRNPNFPVEAAAELGFAKPDLPYAAQYWRATWPRNPQPVS
ncbi:NADH:flavin oxidoreductase/NADH oxidase [Micrococcoides hystricis]|uniref:NADH:flavin oxidoreductase/NADH oxidase n=1 Tax=Micrococcoides hystricis TaxID=1572761 RepID=A0ABV6PAU2_9MICC